MTEVQYAECFLSLFDGNYQGIGIVLGWLVEGLLDLEKVDHALKRLVTKWPLLAGRLQSTGIRVPLSPIPATYAPYSLTSRNSDKPITDYVQLPLPMMSAALPTTLFMDYKAPQSPRDWTDKDIPLLYWHLTYFKAKGPEYTCIGLAFPHGVFDGMGIAAVLHAFEAETLGQSWSTPPPLKPGINENKLQTYIDKTVSEKKKAGTPLPPDSKATSVVGLRFLLRFLVWQIWQQRWHQAQRAVVLMPPQVYEKLLGDAREALAQEGKTDVRLSTGNVITAWIYKTLYSKELFPNRLIGLSNLASLRIFSEAGLNQYAHNCFIPLPYPIFTVAEIRAIPLHQLAYELAKATSGITLGHAIQVYKLLEEITTSSTIKTVIPHDAGVEETIFFSNMSFGRVVDINWTGLGGKRTVCMYKPLLGESFLLISNTVTIDGTLGDGNIVMDVVLNRRRMQILEEELERLIGACANQTKPHVRSSKGLASKL
ncbi:hypothetical protein M413DRAFT_70078 [Hebeloma cylindrosporum]|uniref:Uncharacterized protein n=1 Tax=Hebeloma cylindrosporum TaxID=76867 RepID=A0A0C2YNJ6_HEBCY|nr:hypothetical protein M413DRAFT_70078 [Hebeloma cylindrosporum h7]